MRTDWNQGHLVGSVMAVPPLARTSELVFEPDANADLLRRLHAGGVTTFLYGGNANFYNISVSEYADVLDGLEAICPDDGWLIPSVGPDYGKAMDQAAILRRRRFPLAMLLPGVFPSHPDGMMRLVRDFAQASGNGVMLYLKTEAFQPELVGELFADGSVAAVKYAVPREDPAVDAYLGDLLNEMPGEYILSGFGELPAIAHMRDFALPAYTSGSVCIAPRLTTGMLAACRAGDWSAAESIRRKFVPFETQRNSIDAIAVLHYALGWSGLEDMGPILPAGGEPADHLRPAIVAAAEALFAEELQAA